MAKEKVIKTNAMRILDSKKVNYEMITYESKDVTVIVNNKN